eukprot:Nitzschia sp. Nitz4//scaffold4_size323378//38693//40139//NITZ4_000621-RA/size323378-snap-gene-0.401-mRNA-1//1//CDS//3329553282//812//frame0
MALILSESRIQDFALTYHNSPMIQQVRVQPGKPICCGLSKWVGVILLIILPQYDCFLCSGMSRVWSKTMPPVSSSKKESSPVLVATQKLHSSLTSLDTPTGRIPYLHNSSSNITSVVQSTIHALHKFSRPHTIRGTLLACWAGTTRALLDTHVPWTELPSLSRLIPRALLGVIALLLGNVFIVGINQIYDESIDEVNKPFLPLASKEMSRPMAWLVTVSSGVIGSLIVDLAFYPLFLLYQLGLVIGLIYSVPPFRIKRFPVLAGIAIAVVRGFLLNFGVYYAVVDSLGLPFEWSPKVAFAARFFALFATVIAIAKDIPDIKGDREHDIKTLAVRLGAHRVALGVSMCLFLNYLHAIATCVTSAPGTFQLIPMLGGHVGLSFLLWMILQELEPDSKSSIQKFYKHIWDLFYLEYLLYVLI